MSKYSFIINKCYIGNIGWNNGNHSRCTYCKYICGNFKFNWVVILIVFNGRTDCNCGLVRFMKIVTALRECFYETIIVLIWQKTIMGKTISYICRLSNM